MSCFVTSRSLVKELGGSGERRTTIHLRTCLSIRHSLTPYKFPLAPGRRGPSWVDRRAIKSNNKSKCWLLECEEKLTPKVQYSPSPVISVQYPKHISLSSIFTHWVWTTPRATQFCPFAMSIVAENKINEKPFPTCIFLCLFRTSKNLFLVLNLLIY